MAVLMCSIFEGLRHNNFPILKYFQGKFVRLNGRKGLRANAVRHIWSKNQQKMEKNLLDLLPPGQEAANWSFRQFRAARQLRWPVLVRGMKRGKDI